MCVVGLVRSSTNAQPFDPRNRYKNVKRAQTGEKRRENRTTTKKDCYYVRLLYVTIRQHVRRVPRFPLKSVETSTIEGQCMRVFRPLWFNFFRLSFSLSRSPLMHITIPFFWCYFNVYVSHTLCRSKSLCILCTRHNRIIRHRIVCSWRWVNPRVEPPSEESVRGEVRRRHEFGAALKAV